MRAVYLLMLTIGVLLTCFGAALVKLQVDEHAAAHARQLVFRTEERSGHVAAYLTRVQAVVQSVASGGSMRRLVEGRPRRGDLTDVRGELLHVHGMFAGATGEASVVSAAGEVLVDTVDGRLRLGTDSERRVPPPAIPVAGTIDTTPYVSPSLGRRVIVFVTPIGGTGATGVVRVELTLEALGWVLAEDRAGAGLRLADRHTGRILAGAGSGGRLDVLRTTRAPVGTVETGHDVLAFRELPVAGSSSGWVVVAAGRGPGVLAGVGPLAVGTGIAGALLVAISLIALRAARRRLERLASTDALTGLPNRRALSADLAARLRTATDERPLALLIFDLDGFKLYNDTFGHPAGDALLVRLADGLRGLPGVLGRAYRLGGDEFCVLVDGRRLDEAVQAACAALHERGPQFEVTASWGEVLIPAEACDPSSAMRLADRRLYLRKSGGRSSTGRQVTDVLATLMRESEGGLDAHSEGVAALAEAVARQAGLDGEDLLTIRRAAQLHDIGKLAIPDAILDKPGRLDAAEWDFMRRHTDIGARVLSASPALAAVAALVQDSHEAWDATGYPRGIGGEEIPLGARIIAVCDAYDAMVTDRPYRPARPPQAAVAEIQRCAGGQFDPAVVRALLEVLDAHALTHEEQLAA
jgi:diguanylate cyclase (GGDEF)-like protein/putative nucleotidyltransferase with HDIG domain